ncbi:MAG: hypothetical protein PUI58_00070, partial [Solobacterium sp.]|nr:hypothetical protein [Solobacterium sp.]
PAFFLTGMSVTLSFIVNLLDLCIGISGLPVRAPVFQSCLLWHIFSLEMIIALSSSASKPSLYFLQIIQLGDEICGYLLRTIFPG